MVFLLAPLVFIPFVSSFPHRRLTAACTQFYAIASPPYSLLTNYWGEYDTTSGSQCTTLDSVDENVVAWSTEWTWNGGSGVKSFSNVQLDNGINQQLSRIHSMPSTWRWSLHSSRTIAADVAYDLFTSDIPGGSSLNEVMIWLARFNTQPISFEYSYDGQALPIETNIPISNRTWDLYRGTNGYNIVYSFLPTTGNIATFSADIHGFLVHLIDRGFVSSSQYLITAQGGVEATSGTAVFTTSAYSLAIHEEAVVA